MIQHARRRKSEHATKGATDSSIAGSKDVHGKKDEDRVLGDETGGNRDGDYEGIDVDDVEVAPRESDDEREEANRDAPNERTPLFGVGQRGGREIAVDKDGFVERARRKMVSWGNGIGATAQKTKKEDLIDVGKTAVASIPAVILGSVPPSSVPLPVEGAHVTFVYRGRTLMNILDGVSYGLITFPTNLPAFANFGGIGISMFFVSCIVAQIVFTGGGRFGSVFKGGNSSMQIELVPFFHAIVGILDSRINDAETLVATTLFCFALSSILTGIAFGTLGTLRLGRLSEFFPRHILVGTIGGVGAFLFVTGCALSFSLRSHTPR